MKLTSASFLLPTLLSWCHDVQAKAVFAHFMVGNVASWSEARWEAEIAVAQAAHLDAFALNIAYGDDTVSTSLSHAFTAANAKGFKLFFSFDYAGGTGPWPQADVLSYLNSYGPNGAYYHTDSGQPFVSTFEGSGNATDWFTIKAQTNAFFMPDYSSLGAGPALDTGVADGLFNWNAWPYGHQTMNTFVDASYYQVLGKSNVLGQPGAAGKPYMMGVSPMFYTNLPGYDKNWLWSGDTLWYDRWQEVFFMQPDYVEIITWNDWGESHYIGPQDETQWAGVFGSDKGKAAYNYADGFSHDGWRMMLPYLIDLYKTNKTTFDEELLVVWGRSTSSTAPGCSANDTSGNTASQLQIEFPPSEIVMDAIFFWALLAEDAEFSVSLGGKTLEEPYVVRPESLGAGFYFGTALASGTGTAFVAVERDIGLVLSASGPFDDTCPLGITNWNMWTSYDTIGLEQKAEMSIAGYTCVVGGSNNAQFDPLCEFTCSRGYCPPGACSCQQVGPSSTVSVVAGQTPEPGYAVLNVDFEGLCGFACGKGYCPSQYCTSVSTPVPTPTISPFNPDACTGGTGAGDDAGLAKLCSWACGYGYCPIAACECSATGVLTQPPPTIAASVTAKFLPTPGVMAYDDLCRFACERGNCPSVCSSTSVGCVSGSGSGGYEGLCDFSCGRGFCPSPCTCSASAAIPTPTGYLPNVVGYGIPSVAADFGPLCNFTCNHGYCPDGVCAQEISITTTPPSNAFATISGLESISSETSAPYGPGYVMEFVNPDNTSLSLDITLVNSNDLTDMSGITCNGDAEPAVSGTDGAALGCIAESTAWLFWAIFGSGGEAEITTPDEYTDTSDKRRRRIGRTEVMMTTRATPPSSNHSFQYHAEWQPSGNCSTSHCMLLADAPEGKWVPAGNGTSSSGVYHELQFIRSGHVHGHAAYPGGYPTAEEGGDGTTLASRQYYIRRPAGEFRYWRDNSARNYDNRFFVQTPGKYQYDPYRFVGSSVEKTVARGLATEMCIGMMNIDNLLDVGYYDLSDHGIDPDLMASAATQTLQNDCHSASSTLVCLNNASAIDPTLLTADNDATTDNDDDTLSVFKRNSAHGTARLWSRASNSDPYRVLDASGSGRYVNFTAPAYITGGNGANLAAANGNTYMFAITNPGNCSDATITNNANTQNPSGSNYVNVQSEHIYPERHEAAHFFEHIQDPQINLEDNNGVRTSSIPRIDFSTVSTFMTTPYSEWETRFGLGPNWAGTNLLPTQSLFSLYADTIGSVGNPQAMTNLEASLNGYKARIMQPNMNATAYSKFKPMANNLSLDNTRDALTLLRLGPAVFQYLDDPITQLQMANIHTDGQRVMRQFDTLYALAQRAMGFTLTTNVAGHHQEYFGSLLPQRVANRHRTYFTERLDMLEAPWLIIDSNPNQYSLQTQEETQDALFEINLLRQTALSAIQFNVNILNLPSKRRRALLSADGFKSMFEDHFDDEGVHVVE